MHDFEDDGEGAHACVRCQMPKGNRVHHAAPAGPPASTAPRTAHAHPDDVAGALNDLDRTNGPKARVFAEIAIASCGSRAGVTDDELDGNAELTDLGANTIRPRRIDLERAGLVCKATDSQGRVLRRPTRSGGIASVWVLTDIAHTLMQRSSR